MLLLFHIRQVRKVSRFLVKTISAPLPVEQPPPIAQSSVAVVDPTPPAIPAAPVAAPVADPPATAGQEPPAVQQSGVSTSSCVQIPPAASAAGNDMAFVTVALSINITSNGIYATSRCSSPARGPSTGHNDPSALPVATAGVPLKLSLGEAGTRSAGGSSLPTSQPPTPQACPAMDTYLMDLQHKLASLSMAGNPQQQQQQQSSPDTQLPSPSSISKEGTPLMDPALHTVADQVDQAAESSRPRKVLPSTIDIHDLETELSKLHSQGGHPSLLKVKEPTPLNPSTSDQPANPPIQTSSPPEAAIDEQPPLPATAADPLPKATPPVAALANKEQKGSQTEPQVSAPPRKLSLPPTVTPGRRVSRFSVSVVDERSGAPPEEAKIPELQELLLRHEQERKALARKHEEELAAFHARRKQPPPQQPNPPPVQRQETTESVRTPSPGARASPDHGEGRGVPIPNTPGGGGGGPSVANSTPSSSPGTPTRQPKTFTDDLLRLVQDLGSKPGAEKSEKAGGKGGEKAPTLNQLRAGATNANLQPQQQQQQHHSLTQTAGILTPQP